MDAGDVLRAIRWARRLSQRELAEHAGLPKSTIDRIEAGTIADPRLGTITTILAATGYQFLIVNDFGRPLRLRDEDDNLRDRAYRRLPSHLEFRRLQGQGDGWWGWRRIAWWPGDPRVPERRYVRRNVEHWDDPWFRDLRWDDAT